MQGKFSNIVYTSVGKAFLMLVMLFISMTFQSCTQPGGYIGSYFGTWQLMELQKDGVADQNYNWPLMLSFQSDLFDMAQADGPEIIGYWEESDSHLILDGSHNSGIFPAVTGFPPSGIVTLKIESMSGKHMTLSRIDEDGMVWTYLFKKII